MKENIKDIMIKALYIIFTMYYYIYKLQCGPIQILGELL